MIKSMDSKTIKHIASLARIELTNGEEEKIGGELSAILGYIDQLNNINTDSVEPLYQVTGLINSMREDKSRKDFEMDESLNEKLIGQAPTKEGRFLRVKSVLNK